MKETKNIIEALLFVSDAPLGVEQIKAVVKDVSAVEIRRALEDLTEDYEARNGGFFLREVAGGFQFCSRPGYRDYIRKLRDPAPLKLSRASMETLAIVAYRQPVLRSEVEHIRGVNSGNTLRFLQEKKLVRVLGRRDIPGRPLVYGTTKKFLETFDLKDLKDLPRPEELEDTAASGGNTPSKFETADLPLIAGNAGATADDGNRHEAAADDDAEEEGSA